MKIIWSEQEISLVQAEVSEARRRGLQSAYIDELELLLLQHEALRRGLFLYKNFTEMITAVNPTLLRFEHIHRIIPEVEMVVSGETKRLMVLEPPRYFKSEIFSRLMPSYFLRKYVSAAVGLVSYGADLAWQLSESARDYYRMTHGILKEDVKAKKRWGTTANGEMWAAGVGGPLLGRGFHLGIVDDPVDPEKANSLVYQRRFRSWWSEKFLSRQEPDARIVLVMQRLGPEDPVDFLFRREVGDGMPAAPENWRVLLLDEVRSDEPIGRWGGALGLPPTCTLVPDPRKMGEVLAPSRFSEQQVQSMRVSAGPYVTAAQRDQRPFARKGDFWKLDWFEPYSQLPFDAYDGAKDWDTAYGEEEQSNAASGFIDSYRGPGTIDQCKVYIEDVDWRWLDFPKLTDWMLSIAGPHKVEAKASGKSLVQVLRPHGINAGEVTVIGSKLERAASAQPAVANKRVLVNERIYDKLLNGERQGLLRVTAEQLATNGPGLDVNDMFVQAIHRHLQIGAKGRRIAQFA